jgi:tetratricopeptide (TPR) repeat protein
MNVQRAPKRQFLLGLVAGMTLSLSATACGARQANSAEIEPQIAVTFHPVSTAPAALAMAAEPASVAVVEQPSPTVEPTTEPTVAPTPVPSPTPLLFSSPGVTALLSGIRHQQQTWNNCGPATLSMMLSYFGRPETQKDIAYVLRPDRDDKNVSPDELVSYAQLLGFQARTIVGGDLEMLKTLVMNGIPVIVESWFIPEPNDEMGHYLLLIGYEGDTLLFYDSYHGPNVRENVVEFEPLWKVFNRTAVVAWTPQQAPMVQAILGERLNDQVMFERALAGAQAEIAANPKDKYAWFNAGTNMLALGNSAGAVEAFDTARNLKLPWRMMWYQFGPYVAYFEQGRYDAVIELTTATLRRVRNLEESLYWRGRAYAATGNEIAARADLEQALKYNPNFAAAREALNQLNATGMRH